MTAADSAALKLWSFWYDFSVGAVILGVAYEIPEVVRLFSKRLIRSKKEHVIEPWYDAPLESKSPHWLHVLEGFGWFILIIGLVLEQWAHVQITDVKDREIASLTEKLETATTNLNATMRQASQLRSATRTRPIPALNLTNKIDSLEFSVVPADSEEQITADFIISTLFFEGGVRKWDSNTAIRSFNATDTRGLISHGLPPDGISVEVSLYSKRQSKEILVAEEIVAILNKNNVKAVFNDSYAIPTNTVRIRVGPKPPVGP